MLVVKDMLEESIIRAPNVKRKKGSKTKKYRKARSLTFDVGHVESDG